MHVACTGCRRQSSDWYVRQRRRLASPGLFDKPSTESAELSPPYGIILCNENGLFSTVPHGCRCYFGLR